MKVLQSGLFVELAVITFLNKAQSEDVCRMARRGTHYTDLGRKIATLAMNQAELAGILSLTQQSVSGKLTGKIAVTLKDIELLSEHYKVPKIYFVASPSVTPELARAFERILQGPPELHRTLEIASGFPAPFAKQLLKIVQAMNNTAAYYADTWLRDRAMESEQRDAADSTRMAVQLPTL